MSSNFVSEFCFHNVIENHVGPSGGLAPDFSLLARSLFYGTVIGGISAKAAATRNHIF